MKYSSEQLYQLPPLSLYVHIPWCVRKCPYCDFNSYKLSSNYLELYNEYLKALQKEITLEFKNINNREIQSIYIGGGTPSLMPTNLIESLINTIKDNANLSINCEISMEANPKTVTQESLLKIKEAGINRLSMGIQSLNNSHLKTLQRIHDKDIALNNIIEVKKIFKNFNLDLMHSLPNQTTKEALDDLKQLIEIDPPHLSWYQLTIEEESNFAQNIPPLPSEETIENIYLEGYKLLENNGYKHYEVSAFAKENFNCFHNTNYWRFGDYLALGAGASSKLSQILSNNNNNSNYSLTITRKTRLPNPLDYINALNNNSNYLSENRIVSNDELPFEYFLNRLRLFETFNLNEFSRYTGLNINTVMPQINNFVDEELLTFNRDNNLVTITPKGQLFVNYMLEQFL